MVDGKTNRDLCFGLVFFFLDPTDRMLAVVINAAKKKKKKEKVLGPRRKKKENLE